MLSRRSAELIVTVVATLVVAGVLLGTGFARTILSATDGLTWLGDDSRGQVVQVNPTTGRPETKLAVAPAGDPLTIAQTDSVLIVTDTASGQVTVIDTATLTTTGRYHGNAGSTKVLLTADALYVADRAAGTITRLDPATATRIGNPWTSGGPLTDAAIDETSTVWALTAVGTLHRLHWQDPAGLADATPARTLRGTDVDAVLVPHHQGVTIFAPETGQITQTGTGTADTDIQGTPLVAPLAPADTAPDDLVPVTAPSTAQVVLLTDHTTTHTVDTASLNCPHPGAPVVYQHLVYVPCDNGTVLVIDPGGKHLHDLHTATDAMPVLTEDQGLLYINAAGATTGLYIDPGGSSHEVDTFTSDLPPQNPADRPKSSDPPKQQGRDNTGGGSSPPQNGSSSIGSRAGAAARPAPHDVVVTVQKLGQVTISWQADATPQQYQILRADTGAQVSQVGGAATSAVLTTMPYGTETSYVVRAVYPDGTADSAPSAVVTTIGPPQMQSLKISVDGVTPTAITFTVTWSATTQGASVDGYQLSVATNGQSANASLGPTETSHQFSLPCTSDCTTGTTLHADLTASSAGGDAQQSVDDTYIGVPARPKAGDPVVSGYNETDSCQRTDHSCQIQEHFYTIDLSPPASWANYPATCTFMVTDANGVAVPSRQQAVPCKAASTIDWGRGSGDTFHLSVQYSDAQGTLTSSVYDLYTLGPEAIWCGNYLC
jgi:hypothetical protein